jgi:hypothetical protein
MRLACVNSIELAPVITIGLRQMSNRLLCGALWVRWLRQPEAVGDRGEQLILSVGRRGAAARPGRLPAS